MPLFSRQISCFSDIVGISKFPGQHLNTFNDFLTDSDITESAIFQLQTIEIKGVKLNLFFDSGCGDMIVKILQLKNSHLLVGQSKLLLSLLSYLGWVTKNVCVTKGPIPFVCLCLVGKMLFSPACLPKITTEFPIYDLGCVENEIRKNCKQQNQNLVAKIAEVVSVVIPIF